MKVLTAPEVSGPLGATINVDRTGTDRRVVIAVAGDIDPLTVPRLRAALTEHIGKRDVVIDLADVEFCDSSALRVFVDAHHRSLAAGCTLRLSHPSVAVRALFDVSGLARVLRVVG